MKRISRTRANRSNMLFLISFIILVGVIWSSVSLVDSSSEVKEQLPSLQSPNRDKNNLLIGTERYKIVIDAGHGGHDPGAEGASGNYERDFTLSLSKKVSELLQQDDRFEVHMTRGEDTSVGLEDRIHFSNNLKADAFLSIHGNTFTDANVSGTETYYYTEESFSLANELHTKLVERTGFKDRGVRNFKWKVLDDNNCPAILLEIGYLTNNSNESAMLNDEHQNKTAQAIVDGIKSHFIKK
ncbi:N-acetylmuramoyl-L-alanine amidase [Paenibacillus sp. GSMTC-2017]|uniref:N-acetylmuramoyl-L-alanine amidase family protein n=1 Tax=Paenibacillus sp. GSMTC-2017 TaxID=2794350 RepID=UPI0018D87114|nr:N-acetylmuramoyl-L-alanine amidase [Paenibacillus sp. GSMTC-2017]MBH5320920.1 N-acetylmuramoyl-L-alanine amidase [Paenibacillus sp. GSMTC-2017]